MRRMIDFIREFKFGRPQQIAALLARQHRWQVLLSRDFAVVQLRHDAMSVDGCAQGEVVAKAGIHQLSSCSSTPQHAR